MTVEKIVGKPSLVTLNGVTKSTIEWAQETGIDVETISRRIRADCSDEDLFKKVKKAPHYSFNEHYFDIIDDEHKAYWIGFIWADGYMAIRHRNRRVSYEFKISLKEDDFHHLEKFNKDINGNYEIHKYKSKGFNRDEIRYESRLLITNQYFGKNLVNNYGIVPNRTECAKLLSNIPEHLMRHFIRGIMDADGSFCHYVAEESYSSGTYITQKCTVDIGGQPELLKNIEQHLIKNNIVNDFDRKIHKRHNDDTKDGAYRNLKFCGIYQGMVLLHYIYDDATVYLDRKYDKFLNIVNKLQGDNIEI